MVPPIVSIRNLSIDFRTPYGVVHALQSIDLDIPPDRVVGIVGESGSGKSTLVRATMGLLPENAELRGGQVQFNGRNLLTMSETELGRIRGREMSMVFQDPMTFLNPVVTVARHMIDIQHANIEASKREKLTNAVKMLETVGIPDASRRIHAYPHQFSGGMRQRIGIAMALLMNPRVLIADEPTTALDVTLQAQIIQLFREMRQSFRGAILFVSHDLGLVAEFCDHVVVMYAGRIVEQARVEQLFQNPRHPYTRQLIACDPARSNAGRGDRLPTIEGDVPNLLQEPTGCVFAPRCNLAEPLCNETPPALSLSDVDTGFACHVVSHG